jgi:hypothetical protein
MTNYNLGIHLVQELITTVYIVWGAVINILAYRKTPKCNASSAVSLGATKQPAGE